ncbi:glycosyltransferase family protein [Saccharolobus islandicus]|nr:hypothetical protein [Sulfolobus islandicus]
MFKFSLSLPFSFITVSSYLRDLIIKENPNAKITIAHPGVNLNVFYPRKTEGKTKENKVMIFLRGIKYKGDEVVIQVLNRVNRVIPIKAIIVGNKKE